LVTGCLATLYRQGGLSGAQMSRQVIFIASLRRDEPPIGPDKVKRRGWDKEVH